MPTRAPTPTSRIRPLPAVLALAVLVLLSIAIPRQLGLAPATHAAAGFALVAMALLGAWAMRRVTRADVPEAAWSGECERQLLELTGTLTVGVLVLVDGRVRAANAAAGVQLERDADGMVGSDPADLFVSVDDARDALSGEPFDRDVHLHRGGAGYRAHVSARPVTLGERRALLLLLADLSESERIAARLDRQRGELQTLARRLMTVQEDERAALSRELHDDIGQAITAIKLCASSLLHEPDPLRRPVVLETAQEIADVADQTVAKLRDLSLLLRPPQLDALGLEAALRWQAGTLFRGDGPTLTLDVPPLPCRPAREVELACFRIAQEALTNVLRHAQASDVVLRLACDGDRLVLHVEDDGRGFAPDRRDGLGLVTMRERAQQLGGTFDIDSRPGATRIDVTLPLTPIGDV